MTRTCCLDCATRPCPDGYNCRDNKDCCSWCPLKGGDLQTCLGDCEHFEPEQGS